MEARQRKIIVPIDFAAPSLCALELAAHFAKIRGSEIILLFVTDPISAFLDLVQVSDAAEAKRVAASKKMDALAAPLRDHGISVSKMFGRGKPYSQILEICEDILAEMIFMGEHGREEPVPGLIGSNANKVLRGSPVPVITCGKTLGKTLSAQVLVPVDPGLGVEELRHWLQGFHGAYTPHLDLLSVVPPYEAPEQNEAAMGRLEAIAKQLQGEGLATADCKVVRGGLVAEAVLQAAAAKDYDMVWMETHGRKGLTGMLLGSITEEVLAHCPLPVLSIRPTR